MVQEDLDNFLFLPDEVIFYHKFKQHLRGGVRALYIRDSLKFIFNNNHEEDGKVNL